jgi:hypothetical protein
MGEAVVETYKERAREALAQSGIRRLATVCCVRWSTRFRNGGGERARPAASWRHGGNCGRDVELVSRWLVRAPNFATTAEGLRLSEHVMSLARSKQRRDGVGFMTRLPRAGILQRSRARAGTDQLDGPADRAATAAALPTIRASTRPRRRSISGGAAQPSCAANPRELHPCARRTTAVASIGGAS